MDFIALPKKAHDLTGRRFGRLVACGPVEIKRYPGVTHVVWACRCDCGSEARVPAGRLRSGQQSCGCKKSEDAKKKATTHGLSKGNAEYKAWCHIKDRCHNPTNKSYARYGGRGIVVCDRWRDNFETFLADMGPRPSSRHSIERVNNDGPYSAENCRWATPTEQNNNKRSNKHVEAFGRRQTLAQWARELGVGYSMLQQRIYRQKWPVEKALSHNIK
jgi:hypothetical protein